MASQDDTRRSVIPPLAPIPRRDARARSPHGRYDGRSAPLPPGGKLGKPPKSRNVPTIVAAITDPMGDGDERLLATVNRRVDVLEHERSHGLISEAAYRTGRIVQGVLERTNRLGGSNWAGASRGDPAEVRDVRAQRLIDDGALARAWLARIRDRLGAIDTRLLARLIGENLSYADCAAREGKSTGERGRTYIAMRFRAALEDLAEAWTARGKVVPPPEDKHGDAAEAAAPRQLAAIAGGATLARLKEELAAAVAAKDAALAREVQTCIDALLWRGGTV